MGSFKPVRWPHRIAILIVCIGLIGVGGWGTMVHELKLQVAELLGPNGSAEQIEVGFFTVSLTGIELRASREWPTKDLFRAEHAVFKLDWRTLFKPRVHAEYVFVDQYYLSVVRARNGGLRVLPRFTPEEREADGQSPAAGKRANADKLIDHIMFRNGTVELIDEAIRKPPYRILITNADGEAHHLRLPDLSDPTTIRSERDCERRHAGSGRHRAQIGRFVLGVVPMPVGVRPAEHGNASFGHYGAVVLVGTTRHIALPTSSATSKAPS